MRVLIACEFSGVVREAFRRRGHDAWSCDLLEAEDGSPYHYQQDVVPLLCDRWDLMVAHPPCTRLAGSGSRWFKDHIEEQAEAIRFVEALWRAPIERIALENPIGVLPKRSTLGKSTQIIQPYEFGHTEQKKTCLWLKGLPKLQPTNNVYEEMMRLPKKQRERIHHMPPSPNRWRERSRTYQGIAEAMAEQWGNL